MPQKKRHLEAQSNLIFNGEWIIENDIKVYQHKLDTGSKASFLYIPNKIGIEQKQEQIVKLNHSIQSIVQKLGKLLEEDLDKIVLPHPILGNLTMRELLYFTLYHVQHHEQVIKKNLELWEK